MSSALILAAGFGTRLQPLTLELPKPVVPVGDRPLLAHIAAACRRAGIARLVANVHHEHAKISTINKELDLDIQVVVEPSIRGTAGGVAGARAHFEPGAPVLVWNGDILTEASPGAALDIARERDAQVLLVSEREGRAGTVGLDDDGSVVRLRGRVFGRETRSADYIGIMALGPGVVSELPEQGCLFGDVGLAHLAAGRKLYTVPHAAPWSDLGDLEAYVAANREWLAGRGSWSAPGVALPSGVTLEGSILGARVRVSGTGPLRRVIAWPGAPVVAPLTDAVVLSSGRVVSAAGAAEN